MTISEPPRPVGDENGPGTPAIRIGDAERNAAVEALGEHMTTGRLDLDEYGTRSAIANTAKTVGELQALFADLPAPHPTLPGVAAGPLAPVGQQTPAMIRAQSSGMAVQDDRNKAQKLVGAAAAASSLIALGLFFATGLWWWFLLIPLISSIAGSVWGDSWKRPDRR
ncbi:hypothetical protein ABIB25_001970 [Nakamurella sp. UYEF19]|uniref:DUF1707 SHOCT-like domain-containing protein n=1 Tax=Nakamurella sp. UYEF19 TaxID=1756392 RepID=UPI003392E80C